MEEGISNRRKHLRLPTFPNTHGAFFITLVTQDRRCIFGDIVDGVLQATMLGRIVEREWEVTGRIRCEVSLQAFVLMPNHMHAVVVLEPGMSNEDRGRPPVAPTAAERARGSGARSLGALVAGYKSAVTRAAKETGIDVPGGKIWQRNYYEHVIRDEKDWNAIIAYIEDNPRAWAEDAENPDRTG